MSAELQGLERQLADLGALLETPREPDLAAVVRRRLETVPARRRLPLPVVWTRRSLAIAIAMVLLAASAAVATYFGVRGVRVRVGETPPPTATAGAGVPLNLGERTTLEAAQGEVRFQIVVPSVLGAPDEVYLSRAFSGNRVTLLYHPRPGLPEAGQTKTGLLLFEFIGRVEREGLDKFVAPGQVRRVSVDDAPALWVEGTHTIAWLNASGRFISDTVRLSDNVLLWQQGNVTYRLESALSLQHVLPIAASIP